MVEIVVPIAFFTMVATIVVGTPIAKAYARRMDRQPSQLPNQAEVITRLERIEQNIEAVATEVERIAEGQRFTTKLLSDTHSTPIPPGQSAPLFPPEPK